MSQKLNLQQLKGQSLQEIEAVKNQLEKRKASLEASKAKGGEAWTSSLQEELDNTVIMLVDVEEIHSEKMNITNAAPEHNASQKAVYEVERGTEKCVHVRVIKGRRFNSMTGEEMSKPYVQTFTYGEWQLFKKNHRSLGFIIVEALHDPYGDAAELVVTLK